MLVLATLLGEIQPGVLVIWAIAAVILGLTIMVARRPSARMLPPQQAGALAVPITAGPSYQGRLSNAGIAIILINVTCLGAAMLLLVHNALQRPKGLTLEQAAGWVLFGIAFAPGVVIRIIRTNGGRWIYDRLRRADYDGAIMLADRLRRIAPRTSTLQYMRGIVCLYAGRPDEAAKDLKDVLAKGGTPPLQSIRLSTLAEVLLRQKRFAEAVAILEQASQLYSFNHESYSGLAEALVLQDREPQRAVELVDRAMELKRNNIRARDMDRHSTATMWAIRAEALAMLGRTQEAEQALDAASQAGDPAFRGGTAAALWRSGRALQRMNRESAARDLFKRAAEIDPHGLYGGLAASALQPGAVRPHQPVNGSTTFTPA